MKLFKTIGVIFFFLFLVTSKDIFSASSQLGDCKVGTAGGTSVCPMDVNWGFPMKRPKV